MPNYHPPTPISIKQAGGRSNYLNLPAIKAKHNGLGSADLLSKVAMGFTWERIAKDFNIKTIRLMKRWYEEIKREDEAYK